MNKEQKQGSLPRRKTTYGGANIERVSVSADGGHVNCYIAFEEALKLHLSLGQLLGHLNGYDRATKAGKRTAVCLYIQTKAHRVALVESKTGTKPKSPKEDSDGEKVK